MAQDVLARTVSGNIIASHSEGLELVEIEEEKLIYDDELRVDMVKNAWN